jgi:hypothetical protein
MKRKVKKFAGDEGSVVRTRSDKEFEEDNKYGGYGRYMPKTKEYSVDDVKNKLSGLFGGGKKTKDEEAYDYDSDVKREAIKSLSKATPEAAPKAETKNVDFSKFDTKSYTDKPVGGGSVSTTSPEADKKAAAPKANNKAAAPKADAPKAKTRNAAEPVDNDKLPSRPYPDNNKSNDDRKSRKTPDDSKSSDDSKPNRYPAILEDKKTESKPADEPKKTESKPANASKKTEQKKEKIYGQGLTPYEKGKTLSEWSKMLGGGKKETAKETSKSSSKDDDEKLAATRRRAAGMFQKTNEGVYGMKKGGSVSSASSRGDGIAARGKTRGKIC